MGRNQKKHGKRLIVISMDCVGSERNVISGGISTHVFEVYSHINKTFKEKILLLTGKGYDQPSGVNTIKLPYLNIRFLKLFSFHFMAAAYLAFFWRKLNPKAIHIHYGEVAFLPALVAKMIGAKVFITSHGYYDKRNFDLILRPIVALMWKIQLPLIDLIIVLSDDAREFYINMFKNSSYLSDRIKIEIVPNGAISYQLLNKLNESNSESNVLSKSSKNIVLFVGRLARQKNVISLIDAFQKIDEDDNELWLVGDGPDRQKLENYAKDLNKNKNIKFWGWQPRKQVYRMMKSADIFILPSLWEGMPIALLEAYALGLKCVCHRNTFTEKIPGIILLNSPDPNEISNKLQMALETSCQNDQQFIQQYTWENASNFLAKTYANNTEEIFN